MKLSNSIITPNDIRSMDMEQLRMLHNAMKNDYATFAQIVMSHIVKEIPPYQRQMYNALNQNYQHLAVASFRGSAKSTISHTIQGTSDICFAKESFIVFVSESVDQASADLSGVQDEILNNEYIHLLFGNLKGNVWNVMSTEFLNGVYITCKGYTSRIRGIKWKSNRPSKTIMDDVESEQNISSSEQRKDFNEWINKKVFPSGQVGGTGKFQIFGTIIHPQSWLARANKMSIYQKPYGEYLNIPIEKDGKLAWETMYPMEWIQKERNAYRQRHELAAFMQEYYNVASLAGKTKFNVGMITEVDAKFYRYQSLTYLDFNGTKVPINVYIGVDPAASDNESADNCIYFVVGILPNNQGIINFDGTTAIPNAVMLHCQVSKDNPTAQEDKIFELVKRFAPKHVEIETQGYQTALPDFCRRDMKAKGVVFAIREFKSNKSKSNKWLYGLEPNINGGHVSRIKGMIGWETLETELTAFNEDFHEHDDSIDGLFLALNNAYAPQNYNVNDAIQRMKDKDKKIKTKGVLNWYTI